MYMSKTKTKTFINQNVRDNGRKVSLFDKVNLIKKDLKVLFPEIDNEKFLPMLSHVRLHVLNKLHYGRRNEPKNKGRIRKLTQNEQILLDYLLRNNYNPGTTYRWFLGCRIPQDIKQRLERGEISFTRSVQIAQNRKRMKQSNTGLLLIEEIQNIVQGVCQ